MKTARPAREDASDGCGTIGVATEDEYLATHFAYSEVVSIINEKTFEMVLRQQLLDACVVSALHLVAIGSMKQVNDGKLGRMGLEGIAEELQGAVEAHLGGHDAMMDVDVLLVNAGTEVESTHTHMPLLADVEVLGACIAVAKDADEATEPIARRSIVGTRNGKGCHIGIVRQAAHPVFGQKSGCVPYKGNAYEQSLFHFFFTGSQVRPQPKRLRIFLSTSPNMTVLCI